MTANDYLGGRYIVCLPQKPNIDTAVIFKIQCQLQVCKEEIIIHAYPAKDFLHIRKNSIVDENGEIVTPLDSDIDRKIVVCDRDLNLYFAIMNEGGICSYDVCFDVIPYTTKYR